MVRKGSQVIGRHPRAACFVLLALGAVATGLTLVCPEIGVLEWITLVPAGIMLLRLADSDTRLRRTYLWGLYFFMCYGMTNFHWFFELYPLEFTGMSRAAAVVVVLAGWIGLPLLQALAAALIFPITAALCRGGIVRRCPLLKPFIVAALWVTMEWGQTLFWFGVPWGRLAMGQVCLPLTVRSSALFGSFFVSFMIVGVNMLIAQAIVEPPRLRVGLACAAGLLAVQLLLGAGVTLSYAENEEDVEEGSEHRIAVLQGNISSSEKWKISLDDIMSEYEGLCHKAAEEGAQLIIWPETALPFTMENNPSRTARLSALARECDADLLVGLFTLDDSGEKQNSLVLFRRDGTVSDEIYSKRHLVPFGEYLPLRRLITTVIPPLAQVAMLDDDLTPGADSGLIHWDGTTLGSLICFDSIYEQLTRSSVLDGAELIVLSTNDSWFGDSAALRMHCSHDQLRAIESGRTILRSANTGISAIISADGTMSEQLEDNTQGYIVADVRSSTSRTLYMTIGNIVVYLAIAFTVGVYVATKIEQNHAVCKNCE